MNSDEQKMNVHVSDINVSIAPAAVRTLIGVTSALGTVQVSEGETIDDVLEPFVCRRMKKTSKNRWTPEIYSMSRTTRKQRFGSRKVRDRLVSREGEKPLSSEPVQETAPENKIVKVETSKPIAQEVGSSLAGVPLSHRSPF